MVGVDIPVSLMEDASPRAQLGPLGYSFGANANGLLVFHPGMWMDVNFLEDPAHVDLEDIEGEGDDVKALRRGLVDGRRGELTVRNALDWEARVPLGTDAVREYRYSGVEDAQMS